MRVGTLLLLAATGCGELLEDDTLTGDWVGYVENFQFDSGSDRIALVITDETPSGVASFGAGAPPPPATDPNVGYPPDVDWTFGRPKIHEGFGYTLRDARVVEARVRFAIATFELWEDWCPLQTSFGEFGCLPNWGFSTGSTCSQPDPVTGENVQRDCGLLQLCLIEPVCTCSPGGCTVLLSSDVTFDLVQDGSKLDGSIAGTLGTLNVHLERQE